MENDLPPNQYVVRDHKGGWHAGYDKSRANAFTEARITAKHPRVRGQVVDSDSGQVVFDDRD